MVKYFFHFAFELLVKRTRHGLRQQLGDRPDRLGDTHLIVIEDNYHRVLPVTKFVKRFIDHSRTHTSITDESYRDTLFFFKCDRLCSTDSQRNGSGTVSGYIIVIR